MDDNTNFEIEKEKDHGNLIKGLSGVAVAAVILGGIYLYYSGFAKSVKQEFAKKYFAIDDGAHARGDYSVSIPGYEQLLVEVKGLPDSDLEYKKTREAQIKMKLAADLLARLEPGDRERAVGLYRSVFEDENALPSSRAIAINELTFLAHHYFGHQLIHSLFMEEPYKTMLERDAGGDMNKAMILLYEKSIDIFPNSHAYYQIALMQGVPLLNNRTLSEEEREAEARKIKELVEKGDALLGKIVYEPSYEAHIQLCRAMSLGIVQSIVGGVGLDKVDAGYKTAIAVAQSAKGDVFAQGSGIISRLIYSVFLVKNAEALGKTKTELEIAQQLTVFGNKETMALYPWIRNYLNVVWLRPDTDYMKTHVRKLVLLSPELKEYLTSTTNWTF